MPAHHPRAHDFDSQSNARPRRATFPQDARTPSHATLGTSRAFAITACVLLLASALPSGGADMGNATTSYNAAPPAFGAGGDTTVPASVAMRNVYGSLTLSPTALSAANVTISICGGAVLENFNVPQISGATETLSYAFTVTGDDCYRFNNNLDPSTANRIASYNYVDVANESFESRAHANATWCPLSCGTDNDSAYETLAHAVASRAEMNATSAATYCALTDCANNTYLNSTVSPPTGFRIDSLTKETGSMVLKWDANTTAGPDTHTFVYVSGSPGPSDEGNTSVSLAFAFTCDGFVEAWNQNIVTGAQSERRHIDYNCDHQYSLKNKDAVKGFSVQSNATLVHFTWDSDAAAEETTFEIDGNASSTLPPIWRSWDNWSFAPSYQPIEAATRTFDAPLSDFTGPHTFLRMLTKTDTGDEPGANEGEDRSFTVSCEVDFVADGEPHSCGTLAPATPPGNVTFLNQTVNASGESFLPVLFGANNDNAGMGDNIVAGSYPHLSATGSQFNIFPGNAITSPFPNADATSGGSNSSGEDDLFTMTRNGTFLSADIRAIGPYQDAGDGTATPSTEDVSLLIELQKNDVTLGSATWAPGEVATKTITLAGGTFVEGDNFRLVLTPSNTAPTNATYFNLVEGTYGILWAGNASASAGPDDDSAYATWSFVNATSGGASDFFGSPFVQLLPYVSVLFLILMAFVSLEGFVTNLVTTVLALLLTFGVALSKTRIDDGIAPYATIILGTGFVLMSALMALKLVRPGINKL